MELPFEVIDHIFSFLKSHPKALMACSGAHPVLAQIVKRHFFRHIIVNTGFTNFTHSFNLSDLGRLLVKTPRIVKYATVLTIELHYEAHIRWMRHSLKEIATVLPMLPVLECIILSIQPPWRALSWEEDIPRDVKNAMEDCFNLPSLQEVHLGNLSFPLSILNNHTNITYLSLSGPPIIETQHIDTTYPQIKTLALKEFNCGYNVRFLGWAKQHIVGLQSLKYDLSCQKMISEVFKICSDTLEDLCLYFYHPGRHGPIDLSSLPHLRHLTIHVNFWYGTQGSYLPEAVESFKTAPMLQKITIGMHVDPSMADHKAIDLSPLKALTDSSFRFPRVDLYMYTGSSGHRVTHAMMYSWLVKHEGLLELVERDMLVVHPEETASPLSRSYIAKEHI